MSVGVRKQERQTKQKEEIYVYVFLAVNQYANEAWSVILLQLISLNPPSPVLGTTHAHRHAWVNTTAQTHTRLVSLTELLTLLLKYTYILSFKKKKNLTLSLN